MKKPIGVDVGIYAGIGVGLLINREVVTSVGEPGILRFKLYAKIILNEVNNWVGSYYLGCIRGL